MVSAETALNVLCFVILHQCAAVTPGTNSLQGRKVLWISIDGFRHDYLQKANTPNFDAFIASGVQVPYVNASFSTMTIPCHTSMATGLYDESHGMVGNSFYDPLYQSNFSMWSNPEAKWWNASEPVWTSAVKAGLKVGTLNYPGSDTEHDGVLPKSYQRYNGSVSFTERVRTVMDWLSSDNYDFAVVHFNEPDDSGHRYGPDNPKLVPVIERMDSVLGLLMESPRKANIKDKVDVVITSDHGMANTNVTNLIDLLDYVNDTVLAWGIPKFSTAINLMPQPDKAQELVDALKKVEHLNVFLKEDIPDRFHLKNNRRVLPVYVYADEGWLIAIDKNNVGEDDHFLGDHGYDNELMSMKPFFVASGPSFKSGFLLPGPITSMDIYPLLCHLLKLTPHPNNGSLERVMPLFRVDTTPPTQPDTASVYVGCLAFNVLCLTLFWLL